MKMNRYSRTTQKSTVPTTLHPYELRFIDNGQKKIVPADSLVEIEQKYPLEFLRSPDVAVMDMRGDKPKSILY